MSEVIKTAIISPCGHYRYLLTRHWDADLPVIAFVGLNPSTADARQDDNTIRRCIAFARAWGYGSLQMINLFAYRATDPEQMMRQDNPIGPDNMKYVHRIVETADMVVAAWGVHGHLTAQEMSFMSLANKANRVIHCMGYTKHGAPKHPCRLPNGLMLEPFSLTPN